jgi:hypothetical protein
MVVGKITIPDNNDFGLIMMCSRPHFEIFFGRSFLLQTVFDDVLIVYQVLYVFERFCYTLDSQERSQVRSVRRDHDEREKPPNTSDQPSRHGTAKRKNKKF